MALTRILSVGKTILPFAALSILLSHCSLFDSEKPPAAESEEEKSKGFSLIGFLFGKEKETEEDPQPQAPTPQKIEVGAVHLVNKNAGFVLIRSTRLATIPDHAEMISYTAEGRPTGKLRISPERKGSFLVADILEGNPQVDEKVVFYAMIGSDGSLNIGSNPDETEILE